MASKANRPGDYILEVAGSGRALTKAAAKHIPSQKYQIAELENLFADISNLTSLLTDLGTTINKYENDVHIKDDITRPICEICAGHFEKLHIILGDTTETGMWESYGGIDAWDFWTLFSAALGGRTAAADLCRRTESMRHSLLLLSDTIKYTIFKKLKEENRLNPFQADCLESLEAKLPHIATTLEQAEEQQISGLEPPYRRLRKVSMRLPSKLSHDLETSSQTTLAELSACPKTTPLFDERLSGIPEKRVFGGNYPAFPKTFPNGDAFRGPISAYPKNGLSDDDRGSISSFDTMATDQFLDTDEIYEEWVLKWTIPKRERISTLSLLGLKVANYEDFPGFWSTEAQFRSQAELKEKHSLESCGMSRSKYEAWIDKSTRALPTEAQSMLFRLINDRECSSSPGPKHWFIAAIEPNHKESSLFGLRSKCTEWLVMLKGEAINELGTSRPSRCADPWRKPMSREEYRARCRRERKQLANERVPHRKPCSSCGEIYQLD